MAYDPRTVALSADLFHPPLPLDPRPVQALHNEMFEARTPAYTSFNVTPQGPVLSNPPVAPNSVSQVAFREDRVQIREEITSLTVEDFAARVGEVGQKLATARSIPVFVGQVVTLRSLVNPQGYDDARQYLKEGMFGFEDEPETFGRPANLFGLRMVFPASEDETTTFGLRIESFASDPRSLFVEVQGTFGPVLTQRDLAPLGERVLETYRFLTTRALSFIKRFDASNRGPGPGR